MLFLQAAKLQQHGGVGESFPTQIDANEAAQAGAVVERLLRIPGLILLLISSLKIIAMHPIPASRITLGFSPMERAKTVAQRQIDHKH